MKFDFNTDDDAAKTTTGADAMTSATGVWLDCVMPINQWSRADSRACVTSSDGRRRATETAKPPSRDRARLSVAVDVGHADVWRPMHGVAAASRANTSISRASAWSPRQLGQR